MRITARQTPFAAGLIIQATRGYEIRIHQNRVGTVAPKLSVERFREVLGWYFYASSDKYSVPSTNTAAWDPPKFWPTKEEARTAALSYVRKHAKEPRERSL